MVMDESVGRELKEKSSEGVRRGGLSTEESKRNLVRNTISQIVLFLFNTATSMYFVPFQIHYLGVANYGTVTLATHITNWADILAVGVTGTNQRFVLFHISRGEDEEAQSYFSTQLSATVLFSILLLPAAVALALLSPRLFRIPQGQETNTQILFFFTYMTYAAVIITSVLEVGMLARQRIDIRSVLSMIQQVLSYVAWIILFSLLVPSTWHIGFGRFLSMVILLALTLVTLVKLTPQLRPTLRGFDIGKFSETFKMGGWMMLSRSGAMLYLFMDTLIINLALGPEQVGRYGTIANVYIVLRSLSGRIWSIVTPPTIALFAAGDYEGLMKWMARAVKYVSIALAILLGVICGFSVPFLTWWLGKDFASLNLLLWILLSQLVVNISMDVPLSITYAANRLVGPSVATLAGGAIKLVIAVLLIHFTKLGLIAVAVADVIALSMKNLIMQPYFCSRSINSSSAPLYKALVPSVFLFAAVSASAWMMTKIWDMASFLHLLVGGTALVVIFGGIAWALAFNHSDREFVRKILPGGSR